MVLRQRISEIGQEVLRLRGENEALLRAKTKTNSYQQRLEALLREVHTLEAVQADHNLALDRLRTSIDPVQLRLYLKNLQAPNTEAVRVVNEHVLQRQHLEQEAERLVEERSKAAQTEEERIKQYVDAETYELYHELIQQKEMMEGEVRRQEDELAKVYQEKGEQQQQQQEEKQTQEQQQYQQQHQALQVDLRRLESMRRYLEEEELPLVSLWRKEPEEAEARLLAKVKEDRQRTEEVEAQCRVFREGGRGGGEGGLEAAVERARQELQEAQEEVELLVGYLRGINNNNSSDETKKGKSNEQARDDLNPDAFENEEEEEGGEEVRIELLKERTKRLQELEKLRTMEEETVVEIKGLKQKADSLKEEMSVWASHLSDGEGEVGEGGGGGGGRGGGEGEERRVLKEECLELVGRLNALLCEAGGRVG